MDLEYHIKQADKNSFKHKKGVTDILNYYIDDIESTCADYREKKINIGEIRDWMKNAEANDYPFYVVETIIDGNSKVIGFGYLFPHCGYNFSSLSRTADLTIFIDHNYRDKGIGSAIFDKLISDAKGRDIDNIMASISSRNPDSIKFHKDHGFEECGIFTRAGKKNGKDFDIVWMQRHLDVQLQGSSS